MIKKSIIIILSILSIQLYAYTEPVIAGFAMTDPDSGFNSIRNPALISFQKGNRFSILYTQSRVTGTDGDLSINDIDYTFDSEIDTKFDGSVLGSWALHSGRFSYGLGIRGPSGDSVFKKQITDSSYTIATISSEISEEEKSYGLGLVAASSVKFARNRSFGISFQMDGEVIEKNKSEVTPSTPSDILLKSTSQYYSLGCILGYYESGNSYSLGMGISLGEYAFEKNNFEYTDNLNSANNNSESVSFHYVQKKGIGYSLGVMFPVKRTFDLKAEVSFVFPYISKNETYSGGVTEDRVRYSYSMVAGFQWRALNELNIYSSVIYSKVNSETYESRSKTEKREVEFYALTLGGDYGLTDDVAITFAVRNTIVSIKNRGLASNMKTSIDLNVATAALGIMKKY